MRRPDAVQASPLDCDPAPRWIILPRDPEPLKRWLRAKQAEEPEVDGQGLPPEPPTEEGL